MTAILILGLLIGLFIFPIITTKDESGKTVFLSFSDSVDAIFEKLGFRIEKTETLVEGYATEEEIKKFALELKSRQEVIDLESSKDINRFVQAILEVIKEEELKATEVKVRRAITELIEELKAKEEGK